MQENCSLSHVQLVPHLRHYRQHCAVSIDWFHLRVFAWDCSPTGWIFLIWWKCFLGDVPFSSGTSSCHKVKHLENVAGISGQGVMAVVPMMAIWVCIWCPGTWFVLIFLWDVTNQIHYYICENLKDSLDLRMADVQYVPTAAVTLVSTWVQLLLCKSCMKWNEWYLGSSPSRLDAPRPYNRPIVPHILH